MLHQFMKERSHYNVKFVTTTVLKKEVQTDMMELLPWKKSHSNRTFVTTDVIKKWT